MAKIELPPLVSEDDVSRVVTAHKACKDGNCSECSYKENRWGCEDNLTDDIVKYFAYLMNENTELRKKVKEQEEVIEKFAKYPAKEDKMPKIDLTDTVEAEDKAVIMQALYSYYHWAASECLDNDYEKALVAIRRMESYMPENEKSFKPTLKDGNYLCGNCGYFMTFPRGLRNRCPWCQKKVRWEDD